MIFWIGYFHNFVLGSKDFEELFFHFSLSNLPDEWKIGRMEGFLKLSEPLHAIGIPINSQFRNPNSEGRDKHGMVSEMRKVC